MGASVSLEDYKDLLLCLEEFNEKKSKEEEHMKKLERKTSAERQKVYQDVFLEEMQHYIQYGATEKLIVGTPPSQSLDDITLEDDIDLQKQLNEFLETEPQERLSRKGDSERKESLENVEN